jgi:hypothetical protein
VANKETNLMDTFDLVFIPENATNTLTGIVYVKSAMGSDFPCLKDKMLISNRCYVHLWSAVYDKNGEIEFDKLP